MDLRLRNKVVLIQKRFLKAIRSHQDCYEKVLNGDTSTDLTIELENIRRQLMRCNAEQCTLLRDMGLSGEPIKFNLYDTASIVQAKKPRRRKDAMSTTLTDVSSVMPVIATPIFAKRRSGDGASSSSESPDTDSPFESEEDEEAEQPLPLPLSSLAISARTPCKVKPKIHRGVRLTKEQKEELNKMLPVYPPTTLTPPPETEDEEKARFMSALNLIPKEELATLLNRKTERKRRTAANNNTYVYNKDWDGSLKRKQYLATKATTRGDIKKKATDDTSSPSSSQQDSNRSSKEKCKDCSLYVVSDLFSTCLKCRQRFHSICKATGGKNAKRKKWCAKCRNVPAQASKKNSRKTSVERERPSDVEMNSSVDIPETGFETAALSVPQSPISIPPLSPSAEPLPEIKTEPDSLIFSNQASNTFIDSELNFFLDSVSHSDSYPNSVPDSSNLLGTMTPSGSIPDETELNELPDSQSNSISDSLPECDDSPNFATEINSPCPGPSKESIEFVHESESNKHDDSHNFATEINSPCPSPSKETMEPFVPESESNKHDDSHNFATEINSPYPGPSKATMEFVPESESNKPDDSHNFATEINSPCPSPSKETMEPFVPESESNKHDDSYNFATVISSPCPGPSKETKDFFVTESNKSPESESNSKPESEMNLPDSVPETNAQPPSVGENDSLSDSFFAASASFSSQTSHTSAHTTIPKAPSSTSSDSEPESQPPTPTVPTSYKSPSSPRANTPEPNTLPTDFISEPEPEPTSSNATDLSVSSVLEEISTPNIPSQFIQAPLEPSSIQARPASTPRSETSVLPDATPLRQSPVNSPPQTSPILPSATTAILAPQPSTSSTSPANDGQTSSSRLEESENFRLKLVNAMRSRLMQKAQLEQKAVALSVSIALQERVKNDLLQEHKEVNQKIDIIEDIVERYQKQKPSSTRVQPTPTGSTPKSGTTPRRNSIERPSQVSKSSTGAQHESRKVSNKRPSQESPAAETPQQTPRRVSRARKESKESQKVKPSSSTDRQTRSRERPVRSTRNSSETVSQVSGENSTEASSSASSSSSGRVKKERATTPSLPKKSHKKKK